MEWHRDNKYHLVVAFGCAVQLDGVDAHENGINE